MVLVDGNNVMGAAADGWWRDRAGAARKLVGRLRCYGAATGTATGRASVDSCAAGPCQ